MVIAAAFIIGTFVGAFVGMLTMAAVACGHIEDEQHLQKVREQHAQH